MASALMLSELHLLVFRPEIPKAVVKQEDSTCLYQAYTGFNELTWH